MDSKNEALIKIFRETVGVTTTTLTAVGEIVSKIDEAYRFIADIEGIGHKDRMAQDLQDLDTLGCCLIEAKELIEKIAKP